MSLFNIHSEKKDIIQTELSRCRLVVVVLAMGVALLYGRGRRASHDGAGGFDPCLGKQGGANGGSGCHGNLDNLVPLDEPDERFDAVQGSLGVPLLLQEALSHIHTLFKRFVELLVFFFQMSALFL